jgi:hypothetical protein
MLQGYGTRTRRTVRILTLAYCVGRFDLEAADLDAVVAHSEAFFVRLPLRIRAVVLLVLRLFEMTSFFVAPGGRPLGDKTVLEQRRVYESWFAERGYMRSVLGQILHLTFVGSVYSLPKIQSAIRYERVRSVR